MPEVLVEKLDRVEVWTLNRPQARNAISRQLLAELTEHLARVKDERTLCAVVITGAGDEAFCAGADLKERSGMSEDEVRAFLTGLRDGLRAVETSDRVFIAAINGAALGGGTELSLACDLRVASENAMLGLTEVTLGIIPGGGGTQRLPRLVGPGLAKELILTGKRIDAEEARRIGLVNRVAPKGGAKQAAVELAQAIAKNAPIALAAAKHAVDDGAHLPLAEALKVEHQQYARTLGTKDRLEGLAAFREKRAPVYKGE